MGRRREAGSGRAAEVRRHGLLTSADSGTTSCMNSHQMGDEFLTNVAESHAQVVSYGGLQKTR